MANREKNHTAIGKLVEDYKSAQQRVLELKNKTTEVAEELSESLRD